MREEAREHPYILVDKSNFEMGYYGSVSNVIGFNYCSSDRLKDDDIIIILLHELDHWAQFMFLDYDDIRKLNWSHIEHSNRFIEKTNNFNGDKNRFSIAYEEELTKDLDRVMEKYGDTSSTRIFYRFKNKLKKLWRR